MSVYSRIITHHSLRVYNMIIRGENSSALKVCASSISSSIPYSSLLSPSLNLPIAKKLNQVPFLTPAKTKETQGNEMIRQNSN